jgi:predicted aconitase with swiveling domain
VRTVKCRKLIGGVGEGEALVSREAINFYLCDPSNGVLLEKNHHLKGKSFANKVVVLPTGKGSSVVQLDGLFQMMEKKNLPKALIVIEPEPVLVSSVYVVNVPMVDQAEADPYEFIEDGDWVKVDSDNQTITVTKKTEKT